MDPFPFLVEGFLFVRIDLDFQLNNLFTDEMKMRPWKVYGGASPSDWQRGNTHQVPPSASHPWYPR